MTASTALKDIASQIHEDEKVILTDVDGVLLDLTPQMSLFLKEEKNIIVTPEDWKKSYWLHEIIGGDIEINRQLFIEFSHSEYFKSVPAKECALEVFEQLKEEGWKFIAITAAGQDCPKQDIKKVHQNRWDNLETHFGDVFTDLHITNFNQCKSVKLKDFQETWWIEDSVKNAHVGHDHGHRAVIMHSQYYKEEENVKKLPVAKSWHCIKEMIDGHEA